METKPTDLNEGDLFTEIRAEICKVNELFSFETTLHRSKVYKVDILNQEVKLRTTTTATALPSARRWEHGRLNIYQETNDRAKVECILVNASHAEEGLALTKVFAKASALCDIFTHANALAAVLAPTATIVPVTNIDVDITEMLKLSWSEATSKLRLTVHSELNMAGYESMAERFLIATNEIIDLIPMITIASVYVILSQSLITENFAISIDNLIPRMVSDNIKNDPESFFVALGKTSK